MKSYMLGILARRVIDALSANREIFGAALIIGLLCSMLLGACVSAADVPEIEIRSQSINKMIMCPICPGESIDQSQNTLSAHMRTIVKEKLEDGWTDKQIRDFFVERYGPSVLLEPPSHGLHLIAWILPPIGVVTTSVALFLVVRSMRRRKVTDDYSGVAVSALSEAERERYFLAIEQLMSSEDRSSSSRRSDSGSSNPTKLDRD